MRRIPRNFHCGDSSLSLRMTICFLIIIFSVTAFASEKSIHGDGKICIYSYYLNEVSDTKISSAKEIKHIFRSRSDNKEMDIDPALIDQLDNIQDHFGADCIELISGYRSPELNKSLKDNGTSAAENSMHLVGKAADIHIDEVTEEAVSDYARSLKRGGVGFYPANDFVHVDTGDVRNWDLSDKPGRLLSAFVKDSEWQVLTDKDIYLPKEEIPYELMNITRTSKTLNIGPKLQLFRRGEWRTVAELPFPKGKPVAAGGTWDGKWKPSKDDAFGKYRIIIETNPGFPNLLVKSNEFYRKVK